MLGHCFLRSFADQRFNLQIQFFYLLAKQKVCLLDIFAEHPLSYIGRPGRQAVQSALGLASTLWQSSLFRPPQFLGYPLGSGPRNYANMYQLHEPRPWAERSGLSGVLSYVADCTAVLRTVAPVRPIRLGSPTLFSGPLLKIPEAV